MKTVILCGGMGTRLSEETHIKPKPMVEIGGRLILWHILQTYAHYGFKKFVLALWGIKARSSRIILSTIIPIPVTLRRL